MFLKHCTIILLHCIMEAAIKFSRRGGDEIRKKKGTMTIYGKKIKRDRTNRLKNKTDRKEITTKTQMQDNFFY